MKWSLHVTPSLNNNTGLYQFFLHIVKTTFNFPYPPDYYPTFQPKGHSEQHFSQLPKTLKGYFQTFQEKWLFFHHLMIRWEKEGRRVATVRSLSHLQELLEGLALTPRPNASPGESMLSPTRIQYLYWLAENSSQKWRVEAPAAVEDGDPVGVRPVGCLVEATSQSYRSAPSGVSSQCWNICFYLFGFRGFLSWVHLWLEMFCHLLLLFLLFLLIQQKPWSLRTQDLQMCTWLTRKVHSAFNVSGVL